MDRQLCYVLWHDAGLKCIAFKVQTKKLTMIPALTNKCIIGKENYEVQKKQQPRNKNPMGRRKMDGWRTECSGNFFCQFPAVGGFYSILNGTSLFSDLFHVFVKHFAQSTGVKCPLDYVSIMPYVHVIFFQLTSCSVHADSVVHQVAVGTR